MFEKRETVVIAVAQEDKNLETHGRILKKIQSKPSFDIVADINRKETQPYDRTTTYLIDRTGTVREIFPAMIHMRPSWHAILNKIDALKLGAKVKKKSGDKEVKKKKKKKHGKKRKRKRKGRNRD